MTKIPDGTNNETAPVIFYFGRKIQVQIPNDGIRSNCKIRFSGHNEWHEIDRESADVLIRMDEEAQKHED